MNTKISTGVGQLARAPHNAVRTIPAATFCHSRAVGHKTNRPTRSSVSDAPQPSRIMPIVSPTAQSLVAHPPASDEFVAPSGIVVRLARGLSRRAKRFLRGITLPSSATRVEETFRRLRRPDCAVGLSARLDRASHSSVSPLATAHGIVTVTRFGQRELAGRWSEQLTRYQLANGAVVDDTGHQASAFATAAAVRAWDDVTALGDDGAAFADIERSLAAACRWLAARIEPSGRLRIAPSGCRYDVPNPDVVHLAVVAPLARVAERWPDVVSPGAVQRAVSYYRRVADPFIPSRIVGGHGLATMALWELGHADDVRQRMFLPSAHQRSDGAVPALPERGRVLDDDVARLARLWFLTGDVDRGNRALSWLGRRTMTSTIAALARLDAVFEQVVANFLDKRGDVHRAIDGDDGRMVAVRQWCAGIDAGAGVADVGCGAGRYSARLAAERPALRLTGIDVGSAPVAQLPEGVAYRQGQMLDLRLMQQGYDAAFSVEALEHALLPEQAVAEICRMVRPGGQVLIIDKDRRRQPLSDHAPWERWFTAEEVSRWLAAHCDDVRVTEITHGTSPAQHGLFFCWTGVRRTNVARKAA